MFELGVKIKTNFLFLKVLQIAGNLKIFMTNITSRARKRKCMRQRPLWFTFILSHILSGVCPDLASTLDETSHRLVCVI